MQPTHAIVHIDHVSARVLQFDTEHLEVHKVKSHAHYTRQHGSAVRSEHEFHAEVCDAIKSIGEVLMTGPNTAVSDFLRYVEKHRASQRAQVIGTQSTDQATDAQLVALARKFFLKHDQMSGKASLD